MRQQLRMSSVFYQGFFDVQDLIISDKLVYKEDLKGDSDLEIKLIESMSSADFLCAEVTFRSQVYKKGDLVILKEIDEYKLKVGQILSMLVKKSRLIFVVKQYEARRHYLRYFKASTNCSTNIAFYDARQIADYKPLFNSGSVSEIFFCLHHHISLGYE